MYTTHKYYTNQPWFYMHSGARESGNCTPGRANWSGKLTLQNDATYTCLAQFSLTLWMYSSLVDYTHQKLTHMYRST